ncbi:MAG: hypothetical protein JSV86_09660 [Gemmatimonadota bacterium]|nr:MAG: hypothetical protein JSV86_09660 [Gemmatimonadota bacterium]
MRRKRILPPLTACALVLAGCGRDELVNVDPEAAPGPTPTTYESILDASQLTGWIDTVFGGFLAPAALGYIQIEDGTPGVSFRGLVRFESIQDTARLLSGASPVLRYDSARVVISVDSAATRLAAAGTVLQLVEMEQEWDVSASWELAVDSPGVSIPWTGGPGGSLGPTVFDQDTLALVVTDTTTEMPDSVIFWLDEASDSLLKLWVDTTQTNTGLAVVVADSGRVRLFSPRLLYNMVPETEPDTALSTRSVATANTFYLDTTSISDIAGILRVGGINGWRVYAEIEVPDSVPVLGSAELQPLRGSTINKAELVLTSLDPVAPPFGAETEFGAGVNELADDFRVYGTKTPLSSFVPGSSFIVFPDSLAADSTLRVDLTLEFQRWAEQLPGTALPLRLAIRAIPEDAAFGFWEFGAVDGDPAQAPLLRIVFTPAARFTIP